MQIEQARNPSEREGVMYLIIKDNRFLTELRVKPNSGFYGRFRIPGGEIEDGELPVQAAFREAWEETGIIAKKIVHLDTFEDVTLNNQLVRLHAFLVLEYSGEPKQVEPKKSLLFWLDEKEAMTQLKLASSRLVITKSKEYLTRKDSEGI
jgi:8-oxo-dGTP pyrophosphatase MutT (NUDIX family)